MSKICYVTANGMQYQRGRHMAATQCQHCDTMLFWEDSGQEGAGECFRVHACECEYPSVACTIHENDGCIACTAREAQLEADEDAELESESAALAVKIQELLDQQECLRLRKRQKK